MVRFKFLHTNKIHHLISTACLRAIGPVLNDRRIYNFIEAGAFEIRMGIKDNR